jgi:periplasmic protein TonB
LYRQEPFYPDAAKRARVSGTVVVEVVVDEEGNVTSAKVLCGPDVFYEASVQAALKWRFTPTRLSGSPVKVVGTIIFNYNI